MSKGRQPALALFVIGLLGLSVLAFRYADFALVWQPVPAWVPARAGVAYASGVLISRLGSRASRLAHSPQRHRLLHFLDLRRGGLGRRTKYAGKTMS